MKKLLFTAAAAGAAALLKDERRRNDLMQKAQGLLSQAQGAKQKATHMGSDQAPPDDNVTLARKVETEVFRDPDVPKGQINVEVVDRVVTLRGQIEDDTQIKSIAKAAGKVDGIEGVNNLLHTPGTPAPNLA